MQTKLLYRPEVPRTLPAQFTRVLDRTVFVRRFRNETRQRRSIFVACRMLISACLFVWPIVRCGPPATDEDASAADITTDRTITPIPLTDL